MSSASSKEKPTNQSTSQFEKYPIQQKNQQMYPPGVVRQFQRTHTASHPFHLDLIQALSSTRGEDFYRVQFMFSTLWENISYRGRIHLWSSGRFSLTSCQERLSAEEEEDFAWRLSSREILWAPQKAKPLTILPSHLCISFQYSIFCANPDFNLTVNFIPVIYCRSFKSFSILLIPFKRFHFQERKIK